MFKKHSMQIKMVKDQDTVSAAPQFELDPEKINQIVEGPVKNLAIGGVAVFGAITAIKTLSTIAINIAPKN